MSDLLTGALAVIAAVLLGGCGQSDAEDAHDQMVQCISWGAKPQTHDYIICRAMLAHNNYADSEKDNAEANGLAVGMAAGMASQSGSRK